MNTKILKATLSSSILGLVMGTTITLSTVNAEERREIILHDAIHDYSADTWGSYRDSSPVEVKSYQTEILLDEAYHEYNSKEMAAFNQKQEGVNEEAEFAAFEKATSVPREISSERDW